MNKKYYSLRDLHPFYGSKDNIIRLYADGAIPDGYWLADDIDADINCRKQRGEDLPAVAEEKRSIFGANEPRED